MSKKQYIGIIIFVVMILGSLFYWYEFKPSSIKKECYENSIINAVEKADREDGMYLGDDYDTYYKWCLQAKGL